MSTATPIATSRRESCVADCGVRTEWRARQPQGRDPVKACTSKHQSRSTPARLRCLPAGRAVLHTRRRWPTTPGVGQCEARRCHEHRHTPARAPSAWHSHDLRLTLEANPHERQFTRIGTFGGANPDNALGVRREDEGELCGEMAPYRLHQHAPHLDDRFVFGGRPADSVSIERAAPHIGSIRGVSVRLPRASRRNPRYRTPWTPPPSPHTATRMQQPSECSGAPG